VTLPFGFGYASPMAKRRRQKKQGRRGGAPGKLRIVAGNWRGRRLPVIDADGLRPTPERVRETLFNWLMQWLPGKRCLDLFAGTGALGLEALSREARSCIFIEKNPDVAFALSKNLELLDAAGARVEVAKAGDALRRIDPHSIDLVFLDPPFDTARYGDLCREVADSGILAADARVYVEAPREAPDFPLPAGWEWTRSGAAGRVRYGLATAREMDAGDQKE
jgi:16S rRNA (guanine966-N2)-methyltransferase